MHTRTGSSLGRALVASLFALAAVLLTPNPASAEDFGNWSSCGITGIWNHEPAGRGGLCMASSQRDSTYAGNHYGNLSNHPMNDQVHTFDNKFTTINLRSFRNANYNNTGFNNTSCVGTGNGYGPYATNMAAGLSSFKSC